MEAAQFTVEVHFKVSLGPCVFSLGYVSRAEPWVCVGNTDLLRSVAFKCRDQDMVCGWESVANDGRGLGFLKVRCVGDGDWEEVSRCCGKGQGRYLAWRVSRRIKNLGQNCQAVDCSNGVWSYCCPGLCKEVCEWWGKQDLEGEVYRGQISGTVVSCKSPVKASLFLL